MGAPSVEDVALAILFQLDARAALAYDFHADEREPEDQRDALTAADLVASGLTEAEMGGATVMLTVAGRRFSLTVEEDEPVEPGEAEPAARPAVRDTPYFYCPDCAKKGVTLQLAGGGEDGYGCRYCEFWAFTSGDYGQDIRGRRRLRLANTDHPRLGQLHD